MARRNIGTLGAKITADTTDFRKGVEDSRKGMETMSERGQRSFAKLSNGIKIATAAAAALAAALAVRQLFRAFDDAITRAADIVDTAARFGILTDTYQELAFMAEKVGIGQQAMEQAIQRAAVTVGQANNGNERAIQLYKDLGVSLRDSSGMLKTQDQILEETIKTLGTMENTTERVRIATELFGREGMKLAEVGVEFDELRERAHALGVVIDNDLLTEGQRARQVFDQLSASMSAQVTTAFLTLAPAVAGLGETVIQHMPAIVRWLQNFFNVGWENRGVGAIDDEIARTQEKIEELAADATRFQGQMHNNSQHRLAKELEELQEHLIKLLEARQGAEERIAQMEKEIQERQLRATEEHLAQVAQAEAEADARRAAAREERREKEARRQLEADGREMERRAQAAQREYDRQREAEARAARSAEDAANREIEAIRRKLDPLREVRQEMERSERLWREYGLSEEEHKANMERLRELEEQIKNGHDEVNKMGVDLGMTFSSAFEDAIVNGNKFRDVLDGIYKDILRIVIRQQITAPLGNAISSGIGSIFGGGKAGGGTIQPGRLYPVGERGPELIMTNSPARVLNNSASGQMGSPPQVQVQFINQGTPQRQVQTNTTFNGKTMVVSVITDDLRQGGPISTAMAGAYNLRRRPS